MKRSLSAVDTETKVVYTSSSCSMDHNNLTTVSDAEDVIHMEKIMTSHNPTRMLLVSGLPRSSSANLQGLANHFSTGKVVVTAALFTRQQGYCILLMFENSAMATTAKDARNGKNAVVKTEAGPVEFTYQIEFCSYPLSTIGNTSLNSSDNIHSHLSKPDPTQKVQLDSILSWLGFRRISAIGDANCLYRCVAIFQFHDESWHYHVRHWLSDHIRCGTISLELVGEQENTAAYADEIATVGKFCSDTEYTLLPQLLDRPVHIYRSAELLKVGPLHAVNPDVYLPANVNPAIEPIRLLFSSASDNGTFIAGHWDLIVPETQFDEYYQFSAKQQYTNIDLQMNWIKKQQDVERSDWKINEALCPVCCSSCLRE